MFQSYPTKGFASRTIPSVKLTNQGFSSRVRLDIIRFLLDTDAAYWNEMYAYIKRDLKVKPPVSGTQLGYSPPDIQAGLDYVDSHAYWRHPTGGWISLTAKKPWSIGNDSMVNSLSNIKNNLAVRRVHNKPFTVSEYNHPYPNQFGAEAQPMLAVYGSFQGWDGIFQYSYNHYVDNFEPQAMPWCFFDMIARTDVLAHFPACAAIFIRGDVREAEKSIIAAVDLSEYRNKLINGRSISYSLHSVGMDTRLCTLHKTALDFSGNGVSASEVPVIPKNQKVFVSDTGEIVWNTEKSGAAYLAVNTPNTKLFTGFPEGRAINLGNVTLKIGKTRLNWATISLVSRKATGFGEKGVAASILFAATGDCGNTGRVMKRVGNKKITLTDRGSAPIRAEGIPCVLTLSAVPLKTTCYALDPGGNRKKQVPVEKAENGDMKIVVGPEYETVWYELDIL